MLECSIFLSILRPFHDAADDGREPEGIMFVVLMSMVEQ
jgi:hypothetical protein